MSRCLSPAEVPAELGVSVDTAYRMIRGMLHYRSGRVIRVPRASFEAYLRQLERGPIPRVSPNDLRRTLATWLRQAGVEPQLIGAMLRHTDSRLVERVYGRIPADDLGRLIDARSGSDTGLIGSSGNQRRERSERRAKTKKTA
jgi:excisionase family DNA binding protein